MDFCNAKILTYTQKNKEEKLTKTWNQTVPILGNGAKIWSGKIAHKKCMFWNRYLKCVFWLPRYFCYSIEAKTSRIHKDGRGRSFTGMFTCMLKVLQSLKEWKEKKTKNEKRNTVKHKEVKNIKKNIFVIFRIFLKQSEKERKLMATNY